MQKVDFSNGGIPQPNSVQMPKEQLQPIITTLVEGKPKSGKLSSNENLVLSKINPADSLGNPNENAHFFALYHKEDRKDHLEIDQHGNVIGQRLTVGSQLYQALKETKIKPSYPDEQDRFLRKPQKIYQGTVPVPANQHVSSNPHEAKFTGVFMLTVINLVLKNLALNDLNKISPTTPTLSLGDTGFVVSRTKTGEFFLQTQDDYENSLQNSLHDFNPGLAKGLKIDAQGNPLEISPMGLGVALEKFLNQKVTILEWILTIKNSQFPSKAQTMSEFNENATIEQKEAYQNVVNLLMPNLINRINFETMIGESMDKKNTMEAVNNHPYLIRCTVENNFGKFVETYNLLQGISILQHYNGEKLLYEITKDFLSLNYSRRPI